MKGSGTARPLEPLTAASPTVDSHARGDRTIHAVWPDLSCQPDAFLRVYFPQVPILSRKLTANVTITRVARPFRRNREVQ
jgi:hypothetical protein